MKTSIYSRHRFHPDIIRRAAWLYFRFNLSFRDVEDMMAERGVDVSYETIRRWTDTFGVLYANAHGPIYNLFNIHRHLMSRKTMKIFRNQAMSEWDIITSAAVG